MTEARQGKGTIRKITAGLAVLVPAVAMLVSRVAVGSTYRPSSAFLVLAVVDALILFGAGMIASADHAGAVMRGRGVKLTEASLLFSGAVLALVMLLGGIALDTSAGAGGPGSSTNGVAVFLIPVYACGGALIAYCAVWLVGSAFARARA